MSKAGKPERFDGLLGNRPPLVGDDRRREGACVAGHCSADMAGDHAAQIEEAARGFRKPSMRQSWIAAPFRSSVEIGGKGKIIEARKRRSGWRRQTDPAANRIRSLHPLVT